MKQILEQWYKSQNEITKKTLRKVIELKAISRNFHTHECANAKYNGDLDSMICSCCAIPELTQKDLKVGAEVKIKSDNTIGEVVTINHLIGIRWSKAIQYRNKLTYFYPYELQLL